MTGEIKSTLTLDVSKFVSAIDRATSGAESLEKHLKSAAKVAADFDKGIAGVGNDLAGIANNFRLLDQTVESMVARLAGVIGRFDEMARHSSTAAKGVGQLGDAFKKVGQINADKWIKDYSNNLSSLAPAIKNAVGSIIDLDRATIASAETSKKAAATTAEAKLKQLTAERDGNKKIIAEREQLMRELAAIQERMQGRSDTNAAVARNFFGKNYSKGENYRREASTAQEAANAAAGEIAAVQAVVKELKWKNAELDKSEKLIRKEIAAVSDKAKADKDAVNATKAAKRAEREAADAARQAASESARYAREAAGERMRAAREAAAFERQEAMQIAQMWKGMGQMWGASKIERGISAAFDKSATIQDAQLRVKAWGIKGAELDEFNEKAYDLARQESYLSNLDAIQGRFTAIASLGHNKVSTIDATVGESLRTVTALKALGYEDGDTTNIQRNLYGIAETRQVMNDPKAINRTFDTAFRLANVSGGKINLADIETVLRNLGSGANQISDEGLMNITALAEQAKVAGGHGMGGAGAGVSSVGVMIKMAQLYAMGKPISNTLLEQLAGAGLTAGDFESMGAVRGGRAEQMAMLRAMKSGGLKNQQEIMEDPVNALWKMRDPILQYMGSSAKNRSLYFGNADADTQDEKMQLNALQKFWSRSGLSSKAIAQMVTAQDSRFHGRTMEVTESAKNGEDAKGVLDMAEQEKNWNLSVLKMKKGVEDLAGAFEPLIKSFSFVPTVIGDVLSAAGKFAKDNPMIASLGLITTGVIGVNLAFKGVINTFGMVSSASSVFKALASGASTAQTSTMAATTSMAGFGQVATRNAQAAIQAAMARERLAEASRVAALRELESAKSVVASKTGFDRLRAVQDQLVPAQQNAAKATAAHALAHASVGRAAMTATVATRAMAGASKLLSGALAMVGGWTGLITIALFAGIAAWDRWGRAAETAAGKASKAADEALEKLDRLNNEEKYGSGNLGEERKTLADLEKSLELKNQARVDVSEENETLKDGRKVSFRQKVELQRELVERLEQREAKNQHAPESSTSSTPTINPNFNLPTTGKNERQFENSFQRSLEQFVGRQNVDSLKLGTLLSGETSYDEQAKAAFMEKWLGGDFDDGKDPSRRKFVQGGKSYDKNRGWSGNDVDLTAKDAQTGKTPEDWMRAWKEAKQLEDTIKGVAFATERAAAADEEAALAEKKLAGETEGRTDAMRALIREFVRQENANPVLKDKKDFQEKKNRAIDSQAIADYENQAHSLVQKNKEMEAQFLESARERTVAQVEAAYDAKVKEINVYRDQLNERISLLEASGDKESDEYKRLIAAREAGEDQFTQYLKNIQREREEALYTPMQRMVKEWGAVYDNLDKLGEQWANGFMDQLDKLITTGKADWRSMASAMMADLAKVTFRKGVSELVGGPGGIGGASLGGLIGKGMNMLGFGGKGPAPSNMTNGVPDFPNDDATTIPGDIGGEDVTASLKEQLGGLGDATEAAQAAQEGMSLATEANTAVTELNTTITEADTAVVEASSAATVADTAVTETSTAIETVDLAVEEAGTTANIANTASEWAEVTANEAAAVTEFLANGGVADQFGLSFFASGGAFTNGIYSDPTLFKFANGGQFGVMGEAGPEAVMPLTRDGKGRLGVSVNGGAAGVGDTAVNISIVVNSDGGEKSNASGNTDEINQWKQMANRVKAVIREELAMQQRPGGVLYK